MSQIETHTSALAVSHAGDAIELVGAVKFFEPRLHFGFVVVPGYGDVFVHEVTLRASGVTQFPKNALATVRAVRNGERWCAVAVVSVDTSAALVPDPRVASVAVGASASPWTPGIVRRFSTEKGYGFVRTSGTDADVFLHAQTLRAAGMVFPEVGAALQVRVQLTEKGLLAVAVKPIGGFH